MDDTISDRAYAALVRHALAAEEAERGGRPLKLVKRTRQPIAAMPQISDERRAEYEVEFMEAAGRLMDADENLSAADADKIVIADLGCVEFWDLMKGQGAPVVLRTTDQLVRGRTESTFCPRCESIGHVVFACPFHNDAETRRIAVLRRERRAGEKVFAA